MYYVHNRLHERYRVVYTNVSCRFIRVLSYNNVVYYVRVLELRRNSTSSAHFTRNGSCNHIYYTLIYSALQLANGEIINQIYKMKNIYNVREQIVSTLSNCVEKDKVVYKLDGNGYLAPVARDLTKNGLGLPAPTSDMKTYPSLENGCYALWGDDYGKNPLVNLNRYDCNTFAVVKGGKIESSFCDCPFGYHEQPKGEELERFYFHLCLHGQRIKESTYHEYREGC